MQHPFDEDEEGEKLPPQSDPLLEKVKNYILATYEPVQDPTQADVRMTTGEIFQAINNLYPLAPITLDALANWLHEKGFTFFDAGKMRFEWLLKTVT